MTFAASAVHLWWADARCDWFEPEYRTWLTEEEWQTIQAKIPTIRRQAIFAKVFLKAILSAYLNRPWQSLVFDYNAYGKPAVRGSEWHFNLSHSDHYVALALCQSHRVGVDVQVQRPLADAQAIADRFFHASEAAWLRALSPELQLPWFYRLWCAKEAVLKAAGVGIGRQGLQQVVFGAEGDANRLSLNPALSAEAFKAYHWQEVMALNAAVLTVASPTPGFDLQTFVWQGTFTDLNRYVSL